MMRCVCDEVCCNEVCRCEVIRCAGDEVVM